MIVLDDEWYYIPPGRKPHELSPLVLAYIGDAVYEVYVRQYVASRANQRPNALHREATKHVSAKAQSKALDLLVPLLDEEETTIVKRGRNAKSGMSPKNTDVIEYRRSTAFECLIGYLYYMRRTERLRELMAIAVGSGPPASGVR